MIFRDMSKKGILGINRRIGEYILPFNPRHRYPLVDDKIKCYEKMKAAGLPTPEHFAIIRYFGDLRDLGKILGNYSSFAVKPANGSKGNGILIVESVKWNDDFTDAEFTTTRQNKLNLASFRHYLSGILSGLYSLNGQNDHVLIQERLIVSPQFNDISYRGIPDIRIIVFRGFPAMAMIRLPTKKSGGRANLHQGAVGCGVDIATGRITSAIFANRLIENHPDTGITLKGRVVPKWQELLLLAAKCYEVVGLGYLGIDLVLDERNEPMILEMNARPGLAIQTANLTGLVPRLERIKDQKEGLSPQERVEFSKNQFNTFAKQNPLPKVGTEDI